MWPNARSAVPRLSWRVHLAGRIPVVRLKERDRRVRPDVVEPLTPKEEFMTTRIFNALIGIWLLVTAFMWPHLLAERIVTIVAAVLTFVLALLSIYTGAARYLNASVAVLLFLSTLVLPAITRATTWNNAIVAIAILAASLVDNGPEAIRPERELYGRV
jgi:hypothetical protein